MRACPVAVRNLPQTPHLTAVLSELPYTSIMADTSGRLEGRNDVLSSLNTAIDALNQAKEAASMGSAKAAFASTNNLLAAIKVGFLPLHVGRSLANAPRTRRSPRWIMFN